MALPAESLIAYTLEKMKHRMATGARKEERRIRSGLLFTGNVHDAIPRRLLLDTRLSPLDKMAWMMIRLYAQNNEGAIFPTYDELQLQLASPGKGKASRETVSRVLLMLRITGWLSLCKRVRDDKGRVRGNIYAQHDEPLTFCDAEAMDPRYLDMVAEACMSRNRTISQTARDILGEIKNDPGMRHYHSHISQLEARIGSAQTPEQMAARQRVTEGRMQPGSETEPVVKTLSSAPEKRSSETEPGKKMGQERQSSDSEPSGKSAGYHRVRIPNHYVRNITHSVIKNTYVLPASLTGQIREEDAIMLTSQLQALPETLAQGVLESLSGVLGSQSLQNPVGWLLAVLKRAREGNFYPPKQKQRVAASAITQAGAGARSTSQPVVTRKRTEPISAERLSGIVAGLRASLRNRSAIRIR
ncbi:MULTISPECIES: STY4528 family pathogenicity island replication protein [Escherichia]|uniref:Helix-turn-helix domain-containing protein n=1 Tax=Escherichia marmotae TaxID=1499973 RepID=A0ABU1C8W5_9ESCH|nr:MULTISPECIES: STY4528 family pathogenicity island replication protein [Escherichia]EAC1359215.1 helix-turn-helix domain-containing protein [Escherichia coli]EAC1997723.1 helix-turn-helix domain-containing protein [Escherichia coli]EEW1745417.1 helix-turn-helix domain-containing protein [Escherichia coli]EEW2452617.1 helix-turn-helix domain-containing protein [Escherichia coli]EEW2555711.1 helix-turn-helix domain-containing protein [Escherichia coli]